MAMDVALELMQAVIAALRVDAAVTGFVSQRIYDRPPDGELSYPYITLALPDMSSLGADCIDDVQVTLQADVYSQGSGEAYSRAEALRVAGAIRAVLHETDLTLTDNALVDIRHRITRTTREGVTNRATLIFEAVAEQME